MNRMEGINQIKKCFQVISDVILSIPFIPVKTALLFFDPLYIGAQTGQFLLD